MSDVRIRVSAIKDRSIDTVFRSVEDTAKRAQKALSQSSEKGAGDLARATKRGAKDAEAAMRALEREMKGGLPKAMDAATKASVDFGKEASANFKNTKREFDAMAQDVERGLDRISKAQRKTFIGKDGRERTADGRFVAGSGAGKGGRGFGLGGLPGKAAHMAIGVARDIAAGAGIETDFAGAMQRNIELNSRSTALSNAGYMPGAGGRNGQRVDPRALQAQAFAVAKDTAMSTTDVVSGLEKFVAKTGDLATGRDMIAQIAKLAKATNTSIEDMADAAGDASNALGELPNKGAAIAQVMAQFAAQGKEGAIEIKDLAKQMAAVQAAASQFGGDAKHNLAEMGAIAQMARSHGGAKSAAEATTSTTAFANTFTKNARRNAFAKYGVAIEGKDGQLRDAKDIILDALKATGGKTEKMGEMFADVRARKAVGGFEQEFREAGGGQAGLDAVSKRFDDLTSATMMAEEVMDSFAAAMSTQESSVNQWNTALQASISQAQSNLTPALQTLTPVVADLSQKMADWVVKVFGANTNVDANAVEGADKISAQLNEQRAHGYVYDKSLQTADATRERLKAEVERARAGLASREESLPQGMDMSLADVVKGMAHGKGLNPIKAGRLEQQDQWEEQKRRKAEVDKAENALVRLDTVTNAMREAVEAGMKGAISGGIEVKKLPGGAPPPVRASEHGIVPPRAHKP